MTTPVATQVGAFEMTAPCYAALMDLHRLAEARSLAIHAEIARRLLSGAPILPQARAVLRQWIGEGGLAPEYGRQWTEWLSRDPEDVAALLTDPGESACALRQNSPFVGIVSPRERWAIWEDVRRRAGR